MLTAPLIPAVNARTTRTPFFIQLPQCAAILADGMGGAELRRSRLAPSPYETVGEYLAAAENGLNREELAKEAIRSANPPRAGYRSGSVTECDGMGSTVVLVLWRPPPIW